MKKILVLFMLTSLVLASCQKPEEKLEVVFSSHTHKIVNDTVEVELNTVLNINASIFSNVSHGSYVFWHKFGESAERLNNNYITPRTNLSDFGYYQYDVYNIPISDSIYHSGDHYLLSVQVAENPNIVGGTLHVLVK